MEYCSDQILVINGHGNSRTHLPMSGQDYVVEVEEQSHEVRTRASTDKCIVVEMLERRHIAHVQGVEGVVRINGTRLQILEHSFCSGSNVDDNLVQIGEPFAGPVVP